MYSMRAEIGPIIDSCTSHRIPLLDVGEMMHGGPKWMLCLCDPDWIVYEIQVKY